MKYIVDITELRGATLEFEADSKNAAESAAVEMMRNQTLPVPFDVIEWEARAAQAEPTP